VSQKHTTYDHGHTLAGELVCHLPYAVFSVAFCLVILSFVTFFNTLHSSESFVIGSNMLFHALHFMHIVFAATGSVIMFFRYSKQLLKGLVVATISTAFFCTLSDSILPYIGGRLLGVNMHWHLCFLTELPNVLPFLCVGLLNGFILSRHQNGHQQHYSLSTHSAHIFISSLASSFFLIAHGFVNWYQFIGPIFIFLIIAVVVPCTLSDVVVPMSFARAGKDERR
jgi:hypothetical protein